MLTGGPNNRRIALKSGQLVELVDIMRAHARVENGVVVFNDGWSVSRVMAETQQRGFECTPTNIDNVCKQVLKAPLQADRETIFSAMKRIRQLEFENAKLREDLIAVMEFLTRRHGAGWRMNKDIK